MAVVADQTLEATHLLTATTEAAVVGQDQRHTPIPRVLESQVRDMREGPGKPLPAVDAVVVAEGPERLALTVVPTGEQAVQDNLFL